MITYLQKVITLLSLSSLFIPVEADFYFPGLVPENFKISDQLTIYATRLNSIRTHLPFDYY
jgi:hypothetical protein